MNNPLQEHTIACTSRGIVLGILIATLLSAPGIWISIPAILLAALMIHDIMKDYEDLGE